MSVHKTLRDPSPQLILTDKVADRETVVGL